MPIIKISTRKSCRLSSKCLITSLFLVNWEYKKERFRVFSIKSETLASLGLALLTYTNAGFSLHRFFISLEMSSLNTLFQKDQHKYHFLGPLSVMPREQSMGLHPYLPIKRTLEMVHHKLLL